MTTMTPGRRKTLAKGGTPDVDLAKGVGKAATGIGNLFLEIDRSASAARTRQDYGPTRGAAGVWEKTERR